MHECSVLSGKILSLNKAILNRTQTNEVREAETTLAVEVVWKNARSGEVLSRPQRNPNAGNAAPSDATADCLGRWAGPGAGAPRSSPDPS